jgi:ABC-type glutathione transport system ATPase component
MAARTTNLGRKPRPPSRRELLESFKSLEAAKKQRRRSETSATAAEPSSLAYQERVSSGSEFRGTSGTSMERAPEGAGINGLSAIEDNDPFDPAAATPPPPASRIGEAGLHKREQLSTLEDNSDIEIPELGSFSYLSPGVPDLDLDIIVAGSFPSTLGTMDHVVLNLDPVVPMKLLSDHEPTFVNVLETKSLEEQQGSMMMQQEEPPLLVLQFSDLTYTVHKKISRWRRCFRKPTAVVASSAAVSASSATAAAMAMAPPPPHSRLVLDHVSGEARDGEILAVMGPSGSGKSTLIDALAQRIESLEGRITLNSTHVSNRLLRSISAYVMQVQTWMQIDRCSCVSVYLLMPSCSSCSCSSRRSHFGPFLGASQCLYPEVP